MRLAARADNVALVREMLGGFGEAVALGPLLDDVRAAVSEACNNVVLHAYAGAEGPLEVELRAQPGVLEVTVRDEGSGVVARVESDEEPVWRGIGLTVIEALSARSAVRAQPGVGTEVTMWFELAGAGEGGTPLAAAPAPGAGEVSVVIAPARLSGAILGRLLGALAARAGFSIDRLSDVQLVADALAARIPAALPGEHLSATFDTLARRTIALSLDGLAPGGGRALLAGPVVAEIGPLIERLSDEVELSAGSGGETVRLVLRDRRDGR
jgi:anti-sigma regulatory factor (Ser/Thr protein kinase)